MTKKINFEDDIFTLSLLVRNLSDILKLEIDAEFFRDRIDGDVSFIDTAARRIHESLAESPLFLKRQEYLKGMQRMKRSFIGLLDAILEKRLPSAEFLLGQADRYRAIRAAHEKDLEEITAALSKSSGLEEQHMVSENEFKILLSPTEGE
jgi:hypothetical protein